MKDRIKEIKEALLSGCIVNAPRGSGKTRALAEILSENKDAYAMVATFSQKENMTRYLLQLGMNLKDIEQRIVLATSVLKGRHNDILTKELYIDEYDLAKYRGPFIGATTTREMEPKPVKEIK